MEKLLKRYKELLAESNKYRYAAYVIDFDGATDCPKDGKEQSDEAKNFFYKKSLDIVLSDEYKNIVEELYQKRDQLDEVTKLDIEIQHKNVTKTALIPREELDLNRERCSKSYYEWAKARETLDYSKFMPVLAEVVAYNKRLTKWWETDALKGYDVLLDNMEEGYTEKMYDEFFNKIETDLVPFIQKVFKCKQRYNPKLDNQKYPISKQRELTDYILEHMGYTKKVGCIRETIHPFTNWFNNKDVRITTNYHEEDLFSSLYSVIHEAGHALFQLQMDDKYNETAVFDNVTCITHESQSRFYENYLGRDYSFVKFLYPKLVELFPEQLEGITIDDIYYFINSAKAGFIRCDADELTYPLHILIRYNVEKKLFHDEITTDQIPETFNFYMNKYLGITPKDNKEGCFQDVHWTDAYGYFPTYAVGSAYGAMFMSELRKNVDVDGDLSKGDFTNINNWLRNNIHGFSGTRKNLEVVKAVCGRDFNPDEYISYLKNKFGKIYNIN